MSSKEVTVGVLALQGAFREHLQLLQKALPTLPEHPYNLSFTLVKTASDLSKCSALIIPGGESTTIALIAARTSLLEPLRDFVKVSRRPTWGTCAGMILLSESANRTKQGGQDLIGGLDVRVNRNHFGRQLESFVVDLDMPCLDPATFRAVFIRAPVVEAVLPAAHAADEDAEVAAPSKRPAGKVEGRWADCEVEILARLPRERVPSVGLDAEDRPGGRDMDRSREQSGHDANVVAVRQGNVVGTSFHPELTGDSRMHRWWLMTVIEDLQRREALEAQAQAETR